VRLGEPIAELVNRRPLEGEVVRSDDELEPRVLPDPLRQVERREALRREVEVDEAVPGSPTRRLLHDLR